MQQEYHSRKVNVTAKYEKIDPKIVVGAQDFTTLAFAKFSNDETAAADYIVTEMENRFTGKWTCILGENFTYSIKIKNKSYVKMTFGKKYIVVFKSSEE